jgi:hypothetical protein
VATILIGVVIEWAALKLVDTALAAEDKAKV